jgi:YHS domain-containing protein
MMEDPVCGMPVDPHKANTKSVYYGQMYYFFSAVCKNLFDREPEKYTMRQADDKAANPLQP